MNTLAPTSPHTVAAPTGLALVLRSESSGQVLAREPVAAADLADALGEAWRELCLRRGRSAVPFNDAPLRLMPIFRDGSDSRCRGFAIETDGAGAAPERLEFSVHALAEVARRAGDRLVHLKVIEAGQQFTYELVVGFDPPVAMPGEAPFAVTVSTPPLHLLSVPLRPLLKGSRAENPADDAVFPVLYTAPALAKAERLARRGAAARPPVETGAILLGPLCVCPETAEFFCVIVEVIAAVGAEEETYSLAYTGRSWSRFQQVLRARQTAQPAVRMLGQCHGHNFLPNDGKTCEACAAAPRCGLTNVWPSDSDRLWTRAVFGPQQPWGLCHIYGLSARGDLLNGLFSLHDGCLRQRGLFVVPEFNPAHWDAVPTAPADIA